MRVAGGTDAFGSRNAQNWALERWHMAMMPLATPWGTCMAHGHAMGMAGRARLTVMRTGRAGR